MLREQFLKTARSQIGRPYIWGKQGPDAFDCSGYVLWCLSQHVHNIPDMNANTMANVFFKNVVIPGAEVKPGDLLFYGDSKAKVNHVMIALDRWANNALVVVGARGGGSTTTNLDVARKQKAFVSTYLDYWPLCLQTVVDPFKLFGE